MLEYQVVTLSKPYPSLSIAPSQSYARLVELDYCDSSYLLATMDQMKKVQRGELDECESDILLL